MKRLRDFFTLVFDYLTCVWYSAVPSAWSKRKAPEFTQNFRDEASHLSYAYILVIQRALTYYSMSLMYKGDPKEKKRVQQLWNLLFSTKGKAND